MNRFSLPFLIGLSCCATPLMAAPISGGNVVVLKAGTLYVGNGDTISDAVVIIRGGRIEAVGSGLPVPADATVISADSGSITPGLIDANASIESEDLLAPMVQARSARQVLHDFFCPHHHGGSAPGCCGSTCPRAVQHADGQPCKVCGFPEADVNMAVGTRPRSTLTEESSEVICDTHVIDSVDLHCPDFARLMRGGVTTVFVAPDSAAVIGSRGAVVRTGGKDRVLREAGAVKASMGTDPSWRGTGNRLPWRKRLNFHSRRPTTRMGVAWVFRKACYDSRRLAEGKVLSGADTAGVGALRVWQDVLAGHIPLRIQARQQHDILTACRLADEFGLSFLLEEATEAHLCLDELKARSVPVVYGPIYVSPVGDRAGSTEVNNARLHTMKALLAGGLDTALTAHELRDEDGLARQAMYAIRYGVSRSDVDKAVFAGPARMLGLDDQIGTVELGKRGDLVVWSGDPFSADSRATVVLIDGQIVYDDRRAQ